MDPSLGPFAGAPPAAFPGSSGAFPARPPFRLGPPVLFGPAAAAAAGKGPAAFPPAPAAAPAPAFPPTPFAAPARPSFGFKPPAAPAFGPEPAAKADLGFRPLEKSVFRPIPGPGPGPAAQPEPQPQREAGPGPGASGFFTYPRPTGGAPAPAAARFSFSPAAAGSGFALPRPALSGGAASAFAPALPGPHAEEEPRGARPLFGGFPAASLPAPADPFAAPKSGARPAAEDPGEPLPGLLKALRRKEEQDRSPRKRGHDGPDEPDPLSLSPPDKRPVRLNRPRGGSLFGRTIQDVFRSHKEGARLSHKESKKDSGCAEPGESELAALAGGSPSVPGSSKEGETQSRDKEDDSLRASGRQGKRSESTDSLGGFSPSELTAIQVKNIPDNLNDRATLENHFGKIAKVQRICTRHNKKLAVVYFYDHASAALARKKGKGLHEDVTIFWHKKKISPNKKPFCLKEKKPNKGDAGPNSEDAPFQLSPLGKSVARAAGAGLLNKSSPVKKPSLFKLEGDPFDSALEGSEGLGSCAASISTLIGTVAETSEDKYRLLDQRDRVMRQARVKRTDLDKARTVVGTCPDMCPEKERYMRETRSQLSIFELVPGTDQVDHAAAIKEYSRSSADQEEPLPHELRPLAVLSRTMDYLVTQIMDQKEGSLRDWYDFVWNRTRGIRKDITQQHLCDPLTVSLIEKCTRFHIHCAHFLCEEPMSSFDAKINNENMTKCLQSLKEMYQDLRAKGVLCTSEAEFQGYNVLLNLNNGDILREVQQFHPAVRNSFEVKFAVQVFAALNSNNFVRFFKLVQSASYLNACLLHCYFSQIRKDALRALSIAYTASTQRSTVFPLDGVVRMLLFRDSEEATDFLSFHGLGVSDGCVELSRSAFLEPEGSCKARKSVFITQKLMVSVGEVVNGGPLPPTPRHIPVCSFNAQNKYMGESLAPELLMNAPRPKLDPAGAGRGEECGTDAAALPQPLPAPAPSLFLPTVQPQLPPPKPVPVYSDADLVQVVDELIQEVLQRDLEEVGTAGAAFAATALGVSSAAVEELLTATTTSILRHIAAEEMSKERERKAEERRRAEEERLRLEKELALTQLSQALVAELTELVLRECVRETCSQEWKSAVEVDQQVRIARCCEDVCTHLVELFLGEEIFQTAKETLQELQCFCKYLQRWREAVEGRKKLRRQMQAFPAAPCCVDVNNQLWTLAPSAECPIAEENLARGMLDLGHAGKVGISCTRLRWLRNKTAHQLKVQHFYQQLLSDTAWAPLDLPSLVAEHLSGAKENMFWKLVLMLPGEEQSTGHPGRILADWLKVKFMGDDGFGDDPCGPTDGIQTLTLFNTLSSRGGQTVSVSVCIKVSHGPLSDRALEAVETQKGLLGASGLLLLLPPRARLGDRAAEEEEEDISRLSALLQLQQLLQAKPFQPAPPLAVLVPSPGGASRQKAVEDGLMLRDLISANLISEFSVLEIPESVSDSQSTIKVSEAVQWLLSRCPQALDLCCQTLVQYVEDGVSREFSGRFFHDQRQRRLGGLASQEPSAIIELFNSVLRFLAAPVSSEQLCDLSWPVTEFARTGGSQLLPHLHWNSPDHLAWLKQAVLGFQLPQMDLPPPGAPWRPVCSMLIQYAAQIPSSHRTQPVLQCQIENLLRRTYCRWRSQNPSMGWGAGPSVAEIPWDDAIALCINHKLSDWTPPKLPVTQEAVSEDGQICVYFFKNHLKNYTIPSLWEQARTQTQKELQLRQGRPESKTALPSANSFPAPLLPMHQKGKRSGVCGKGSVPSAEDLVRGASAQELLVQSLSSRLLLEQEESQKFEDQLQQLLSEDSEVFADSPSLPLYLPQTLVSLPQTLAPMRRPSLLAVSPQNERTREQLRPLEGAGTSLTDRVAHLERLICSSKEEEVASELHLSALLDMVDI
ncbi:germinal-center associated nuclear protein [Suncus etruscus]|uniref:germinal-center associated nuclear protein n=1 Tax=Suncus etruscus TaxID=109475 RepID=UPI00210F89C5|nr:germinal-center associated nuclear protein [Suncus etruscus]